MKHLFFADALPVGFSANMSSRSGFPFLLTSIIFFLLGSVCVVYAQETKVSGKVYDPLTNETIPFAAIVFKGTAIGTNADINGNYTISTMEKVDSISSTFVGYIPVTLPVQKGKSQTINFALRVN